MERITHQRARYAAMILKNLAMREYDTAYHISEVEAAYKALIAYTLQYDTDQEYLV